MLFRNRYGLPRVSFSLAGLLVGTAALALVFTLHDIPRVAIAVGGFLVVVFLHWLTGGKTSATAALFFLMFGPALSTVVGIVYLSYRVRREGPTAVEVDLVQFGIFVLAVGFAAAAIGAARVAFINRFEWIDRRL